MGVTLAVEKRIYVCIRAFFELEEVGLHSENVENAFRIRDSLEVFFFLIRERKLFFVV